MQIWLVSILFVLAAWVLVLVTVWIISPLLRMTRSDVKVTLALILLLWPILTSLLLVTRVVNPTDIPALFHGDKPAVSPGRQN